MTGSRLGQGAAKFQLHAVALAPQCFWNKPKQCRVLTPDPHLQLAGSIQGDWLSTQASGDRGHDELKEVLVAAAELLQLRCKLAQPIQHAYSLLIVCGGGAVGGKGHPEQAVVGVGGVRCVELRLRRGMIAAGSGVHADSEGRRHWTHRELQRVARIVCGPPVSGQHLRPG